jgi:hypothetical protein
MKPHPFTTKVIRYMDEAPPLIKQMAENKRLVQAYLRGEVTKEELEKRGIELVKPI